MEITPKLSVTEDKIRLLTVKTDMFKTACLTLNVLVPMGEYAAEYAVRIYTLFRYKYTHSHASRGTQESALYRILQGSAV